jgi:L-Ala-D/L-Glu epimerase / N-acetyl-D-glutamate racemase
VHEVTIKNYLGIYPLQVPMQIQTVRIHEVSLPFKGDFSISIRKGRSSSNVIIEVIDKTGKIKGYGEALPVKTATGETPETVIKSVAGFVKKKNFPWDFQNSTQVSVFIDNLPVGKHQNAAICAVETALLDALGKSRNHSILEFFNPAFRAHKIRYGASIPLGSRERVLEICKLVHGLGIRHLRIKMGADFHQNKVAIETVRSVFSEECELRIDPNRVWDHRLAFKHIPLIERYRVKIVEEPMPRETSKFSEFANILRQMGISLMACESAPTLEDVTSIISEGLYQIVNIKLCRSGGFRKSLKIIDYMRKMDFMFQIGCSLGESGILSAAGRALCLLCKDAVYYDGSYDRFLLSKNTTVADVGFGPGGAAVPLQGPGLGVSVNPETLRCLSVGSEAVTFNR